MSADAGRRKLLGLMVAGALALPLGLLYARRVSRPEFPVLGTLPAFSLVDQDGRPFGMERLFGKAWILSFLFTSCPDVCPTLASRLVARQGRLGRNVRLLTITVDPERDDPATLRSWALERGGDLERWTLLTGAPEAVQPVIDGARLMAQKVVKPGDTYDIVHSEKFVLLDGTGRVRGYYDSDADGLDRLWADAEALATVTGRAASE